VFKEKMGDDLGYPAGRVRHLYTRIMVASVEVYETLRVGDVIRIKGHITDFDQKIESMEVNHMPVHEATRGQIAGIRVRHRARKNDLLYKRMGTEKDHW